MAKPAASDDDFIRLFEELGAQGCARRLGVNVRGVYDRRTNLEGRLQRQIKSPDTSQRNTRVGSEHPWRLETKIENGIVLIGSDGHYLPGPATTAHRAFVFFCKELRPKIAIMNGDALDGATISRHPPIGWENRPTLIEEIGAVQERLGEIEDAVPRGCELYWPLGNHDGRFETRIATVAPEFAKVKGVHLKDHFGVRWQPCWSTFINDDVVVKHRYKNGVHATHNNTVSSGKTMVTGHLHSLKVTPYSDYSDRPRWGIDTGTLAEPNGPQFVHYSEDNPKNHRSGFVVLTFRDGILLWPELVHVFDEKHVEFRGHLIHV